MRHRKAGKKLNRTTAHRLALRRNMAASLIEHESIMTTAPKAKAVRPFVDKLITQAKKGTLAARRRVLAQMPDRYLEEADAKSPTVVGKLFDTIAPRMASRPGGYTRIIRLPVTRIGDGANVVMLQLSDVTPKEGDSK